MRRELRTKSGSTLEWKHQQAQRNDQRDWDIKAISFNLCKYCIYSCMSAVHMAQPSNRRLGSL